MSSLMQHHGGRSYDGRKVELLFYLVNKGHDWDKYNGPGSYNPRPDSTTFTEYAETDAQGRPVLYKAYRRPIGMCGNWVVFRYNGSKHLPDLSCPIAVFKLPRGAVKVADNNKAWE